MKPMSFLLILITLILVTVSPAIAQDNPYHQAGEIKKTDIGVKLDSGTATVSNTSKIAFNGAEYTHTLGRVSIRMTPLIEGINEKESSLENIHSSGVKNQIKYSVYKNLIKEEITLQSPEIVRYSYDLWLSDWVMKYPDTSELQKNGGNKSKILLKLSEKETILYAKDSSIDIKPDPWGNLVIYVNDHDVVVLPRPYAIDAKGKRYDLEFALDKENKIITITGNLTGAHYPVVIDPTERVTNGNFNWESVFNGVHIVNGFDTHGLLYEGQGTKYAQKLAGSGVEDRTAIRDAWRETLQETIDKEYVKGAYMWANPCGDDYLPGFGDYCSAPVRNNQGAYDITWRNFNCTFS